MIQVLPRDPVARESLRQKGQFWTPDWLAEAMVRYPLALRPRCLFDPAVGAGAFFRAAKRIAQDRGFPLELAGMEVDLLALREAETNGLSAQDLAGVTIGDFLLDPGRHSLEAIAANPPYVRHHRIPAKVKARLASLAAEHIGARLDGRAGLHVYFLVRALSLLKPGGRLAFVLPADICEGVFAPRLWAWISKTFRIDAVVTFSASATPFPGVDTNPIVMFIENASPSPSLTWARVEVANAEILGQWVESEFTVRTDALTVVKRTTEESLRTGFSRPMDASPEGDTAKLGDLFSVQRGIATGANDFFFLTRQRTLELRLDDDLLVPAIGRTRDILESVITEESMRHLEAVGRPNLLFAPDGRRLQLYSPSVRRYLEEGENLGLPDRPLIRTRNPWYKMERRSPPPFLFAYLGRRRVRFIRNLVGVVPLTCFLCVYPRPRFRGESDTLWRLLSSETLLSRLPSVAKSYGGDALKIEPRALENLRLPSVTLREAGLAAGELREAALLPFDGVDAIVDAKSRNSRVSHDE